MRAMDSDRAPKLTRVSRALSKSDSASPLESPIAREDWEASTYVARFSFVSMPRMPADDVDLMEPLSRCVDHALFLDSSIVERTVDTDLWSELTIQPGRLHVIPPVRAELAEHFAVVPDHPLAEAIRTGNPCVVDSPYPSADEPAFGPFVYYLQLLSARRLILDKRLEIVARHAGRELTERERSEVYASVQRDIGERGILLCKKPLSPRRTDEALVYCAVAHALRTGQRTKILTADHDVEEQFFKLIELVTMHFFAMHVANAHIDAPARFQPRRVAFSEGSALAGLFREATALRLDAELQAIAPPQTQFAPISCLLLGEYVSEITYGAETGMAIVLDVKGRTGGRSTDRLGERDVHVRFLPPLGRAYRGYDALISRDIYEEIPDAGMAVAVLDRLAAFHTQSSFRPVRPLPQSDLVMLGNPPPSTPAPLPPGLPSATDERQVVLPWSAARRMR
jgi:hypothetical protein